MKTVFERSKILGKDSRIEGNDSGPVLDHYQLLYSAR